MGGLTVYEICNFMKHFPNSFINSSGEFIAHHKANEYFNLINCESELEIKCKVIEYFSRGAYKTKPFKTKKENEEFNRFMLAGINNYLGTKFTPEDMENIYTYLGNKCNREKTIAFIKSNYNMEILSKEGK